MNNLAKVKRIGVTVVLLLFLSLLFKFSQAQIYNNINIAQDENGDFGGTIESKLFGTNLRLTAPLTSVKEEVRFEGKVNDPITIEDFFNQVGGNAFYNEINIPPFNAVWELVELPSFDFVIYPFAKSFEMTSQSNLGKNTMEFKKVDSEVVFTFSFKPSDSFKLDNIQKELSVIDEFNIIENYTISVTNDTENSNSGRNPVRIQVEADVDHAKLVNKIKGFLDPENKHSDIDLFLAKIPVMKLKGSIDSQQNLSLETFANLNIDVGNGWEIEKLGITINYIKGSPLEMIISGGGIIPVSGTDLRLTLGMNAEPPTAVGLNMALQSIDIDKNPQEWYKPYGIPFLTFNNISAGLTGDAATILDNVSFGGNLKLGKRPEGDSRDARIHGVMDIRIDADPMQNSYYSKISSMNLLDLIEAFEPNIELPSELRQALDVGVDSSEFQLDAKNSFASINGNLTFLDMVKGSLDVKIEPDKGAKIGGRLEPIKWSAGGIEVLSINQKGNSDSGAFFSIDINTSDPIAKVDGEMRLFGIAGSNTRIEMNKNGLMASAGYIFPAFGSGDISITGVDFIHTGKVKVNGAIIPAMSALTESISQFVKENAGSVVGGVVDGILNEVFKLNSIDIDAEMDNFTTGLDLKLNYTALGGDETLFIPVKLNFAQPENIPETVALIAARIGEQLISVVGNRLETIVFDTPIEVLESLKIVSSSNDPLVNALIQGHNARINAMIEIFEFMSGSVKYKKFEYPIVSIPENVVYPGYRHLTVNFKNITIAGSDEDNGDDVFGQIYFVAENSYAPSNTNSVLFALNEDKAKEDLPSGYILSTPHTSHLYTKNYSQSYLDVIGTLYEEDDWPDGDDLLVLNNVTPSGKAKKTSRTISGKEIKIARIDLSAFPESGKTTSYTLRYTEGKSKWDVKFDIVADQMITKEILLAEIRNGDFIGFQDKLKKGGDLDAIKTDALSEAVKYRNLNVIELLGRTKYNQKTTSQQLDLVCDSLFDSVLIKLVVQNLGENQKPSAQNINYALKHSAEWLAAAMMDKDGVPDNACLSTAFEKKLYATATKMISEYKLVPNSTDLRSAIGRNDGFAVALMLLYINPDQASFNMAARGNKTEIFKLMYNKGNESIRTVECATTAISNKNLEIFKMSLNSTITADNMVVFATTKEDLNAIAYCIEVGAQRKSPLLKAIEGTQGKKRKPNLAIIQLLLNFEKCRDTLDYSDPDYSKTAVLYSRKGSHAQVVQILLNKNKDALNSILDKKGNTLLQIASIRCRKRPVLTTDFGEEQRASFWHKLFKRSKRDQSVMLVLLNQDADPNIKNNKGFTSLHLASNRARRIKDVEIVKKMVAAGADVNACTNKKKSIYRIADGCKVKKYLKSMGAKKKACKK